MIIHIVKRSEWADAVARGTYAPASLRAEGFIHCSTVAQLVDTANRFYRGNHGLVVLCIDESRLKAELKYEAAGVTPCTAGLSPAPNVKAALRCRAPGEAPAANVKKVRHGRGTKAKLKSEPPAGELFPHLYGELNVDAVARVVELPCEADGSFRLPAAMAGLSPAPSIKAARRWRARALAVGTAGQYQETTCAGSSIA